MSMCWWDANGKWYSNQIVCMCALDGIYKLHLWCDISLIFPLSLIHNSNKKKPQYDGHLSNALYIVQMRICTLCIRSFDSCRPSFFFHHKLLSFVYCLMVQWGKLIRLTWKLQQLQRFVRWKCNIKDNHRHWVNLFFSFSVFVEVIPIHCYVNEMRS